MSGWLATFAWQQDCNLQIHGYVDTLAGTGKVCQICMSVCAHRTELWMNSFVWNGNPIWDSPPFPCSYCKLHKLPKIASHVPLKVFGFWPGSVLQFANLQVARTLPLLHPPSLFSRLPATCKFNKFLHFLFAYVGPWKWDVRKLLSDVGKHTELWLNKMKVKSKFDGIERSFSVHLHKL